MAKAKMKKTPKTNEERALTIAMGFATAKRIYTDLFGTDAEDDCTESVLQLFDNLDADDEGLPLPYEAQSELVTDIKVARGQAIELFGETAGRKPAVVLEVFERLFEVDEDEE